MVETVDGILGYILKLAESGTKAVRAAIMSLYPNSRCIHT